MRCHQPNSPQKVRTHRNFLQHRLVRPLASADHAFPRSAIATIIREAKDSGVLGEEEA